MQEITTKEVRKSIRAAIDKYMHKSITPRLMRDLRQAVEWKLIRIMKTYELNTPLFERHIQFEVSQHESQLQVRPANLFTVIAFNCLEIDLCNPNAKEFYSPKAQGQFVWNPETLETTFYPDKKL